MQHFSEEHLNEMQEYLKNRLTKEEFIKAFEQVVNLVLKIQKEQGTAIEKLETTYSALMDKMRNDNSMSLSEMKAMMGNHFTEYTKKHGDTISQKMAEVRNGKDADEIGITNRVIATLQTYFNGLFSKLSSTETRNKLETLQGVERLKISAIDGLEEKLEEIKRIDNKPTRGGFRASHSTKFHSLTADGSTKIFSVPKSVTSIILTSDTPFILFENNGFTINKTRTQITLTGDIAPSNGAQLIYQYSEMFNT